VRRAYFATLFSTNSRLTEGDVDLLSTDEFWDPHAIAGLLKSFLRELPSSILTRELHLQFLAVIGDVIRLKTIFYILIHGTDFMDPQERIRELSDLIARLPVANYSLLRALTAHLIRIVQNANVNKMTMRNVGIVFSPTLGIPAGVFSLMLGEFERVFNVNGEGAGAEDTTNEAPDESVASERLSGLDRRNSQRYTDAAADKLLGLSGRTLASKMIFFVKSLLSKKLTSFLAPVESDEGDEISIQEESTDEVAELSDENAAETPRAPNTLSPTDGGRSKAQGVAASRGLNIATSPSADLRARRQSRMPGAPIVGLPSSPRPGHHPPSSKGSSPPASPNHPQQ
jgi:RalA-binding protein 1